MYQKLWATLLPLVWLRFRCSPRQRDMTDAQQSSQNFSFCNCRRSPHLLHNWRRDVGFDCGAVAFMVLSF